MSLIYLVRQLLNKIIFIFIFSQTICLAGNQPAMWNLTHMNKDFVGRKSELINLKKRLLQNKGNHVLVVTGAGGMGKTQFVNRLANQLYEKYDIIWWFDASKDIPDQILLFCESWNQCYPADKIPMKMISQEALISFMKNKLRTTALSWLLIFDNAHGKQGVEKYIPERHEKTGHVLMTSRDSLGWDDSITLTNFSRQESIQLLKKITQEPDEKLLNALAEALNDYPPLVARVAHYIKNTPSASVERYLAAFKQKEAELQPKKSQADDQNSSYQLADYTSLKMSFDEIRQETPEALDLVLFLSLLGPRDIPEELIQEWLILSGYHQIKDALFKKLLEHSLIEIEKIREGKELKTIYHIPEVVQVAVKQQANDHKVSGALLTALEALYHALPTRIDLLVEHFMKHKEMFRHTEKLLSEAEKRKIISPVLLAIRIRFLECYLSGLRDYDLATQELNHIENLLPKTSFPDTFSEALYLINKSNLVSWKDANEQLSLELMSEAYKILLKIPALEHEKLRTLTNIAQGYAISGNSKKAMAYIEEGEKYIKKSESKTYNALYHFAKCFISVDNGMFDPAYQQILLAEEALKGVDDCPSMRISVQVQKSEALLKLNRIQEAILSAKKAVKMGKTFFQTEDHTVPARAMVLLAAALMRASDKNASEAKKLVQKAIHTYNKTYQGTEKHINQGQAHKVLGDALVFLGQRDDAYKEYLASETIYEKVFDVMEPDEVSELYDSMMRLGLQMNDPYLPKKYIKKHIQHFGAQHPRSKKILHIYDTKAQVTKAS